MRFIFKTRYEQDLLLARHGGHVFWYGALLALERDMLARLRNAFSSLKQ